MSTTTLFIILLFSFQGLYWFIGKRSSQKIKDTEDYFLAGKDVRFFPLMMTFLATQVGGGLVLGAANEAYVFGLPVLLYPLGGSLGLILLGMGLGKKLASFQVTTVAEIFEVAYGSSFLRKLASSLSIISLFMILVAQIIASNKFLVSMGLDNTPLFIAFWGIVILYTAQGGLKAVISTDIVQAAFFSILFALVFCLVFLFEPTNLSQVIEAGYQTASVSTKLTGWLLMPLLFMVIEQDMAQRCFAGASDKIVSKAAIGAGIGTMLICTIPVLFGTLASITNLEVPKSSSVLMAIIEKTTNPLITSLMGCAVMAAIISTATSLINAISSNVSSDFKLISSHSLKRGKTITCILSIAALGFAFYFDNIVDLLIQSYDLSVSCLFVPIVAALFKRQGNFMSAFLSILFGAFGFFFLRLYPIAFPSEVASILLSFFGFILGSLIKKNSRQFIPSSLN